MYKVDCPHCKNRMVDANNYIERVYKDGNGTEIDYRCPMCKEIFTNKEVTK